MNQHISIIYFQSNSFSEEKVAIGLVGVTDKNVFFHYSPGKLKLAGKLYNPDWAQQAETSLEFINNAINIEKKEFKKTDLYKELVFNKDYFSYLKKYSKGLIQFDELKPIDANLNDQLFKVLFDQMIGNWDMEQKVVKAKTTFNHKVKECLRKDVFETKADINYSLKPEQVPNVLMLKELDITLISKNGTFLATQAIDFNNAKDTIVKHVYEFEIAAAGLESLGREKVTNYKKGKYTIVAEYPKDKEAKNVWDKIRATKNNVDIQELDYLDKLEKKFQRDEYRPFSEFIKKIK